MTSCLATIREWLLFFSEALDWVIHVFAKIIDFFEHQSANTVVSREYAHPFCTVHVPLEKEGGGLLYTNYILNSIVDPWCMQAMLALPPPPTVYIASTINLTTVTTKIHIDSTIGTEHAQCSQGGLILEIHVKCPSARRTWQKR